MINVVIDTNLIVADFFNPESDSAKVMNLAREGKINVLWSEPILREIKKVLNEIQASAEYKATLLNLLKDDRKITQLQKVKVVEGDDSDDKFLSCALKGASYIITHDTHLLKVREYQGIKLVRPTDFIKNNIFS